MAKGSTVSQNSATAPDDLAKGLALYAEGRAAEAVQVLSAATLENPENDALYAALARILLETGNTVKSIEYNALAMQANPAEPAYKQMMVSALRSLRFKIFNPQIQGLILECLRAREIDHQELLLAWQSFLKIDPRFRTFYKAGKSKDYAIFKKKFMKLSYQDALMLPFFLLGLRSLLIPDIVFEKFLTYLRRFLLEMPGTNDDLVFHEDHQGLLAALAIYCFHTEYVFDVTPEEQARVDALTQAVESGGKADELHMVLTLACYRPLYYLRNIDAVEKTLAAENDMQELIKVHLHDYREEQAIRKSIPALTEIENVVSAEVRAQYEGFPYPRWKTLKDLITQQDLENFLSPALMENLKKPGAKILIAGCGTGFQALEHGIIFPQAEILAVDLSLSSLSYALRKNRERKVGNVKFMQGDILKLGVLPDRFDLIVCTGVLHHMQDPADGWAVLNDLLKPNGLMRIALYSEAARKFVVNGRAAIARGNYAHDADGIRAFRRDASRILKRRDLKIAQSVNDFYLMSECRDLFFHVQEHRFEIPQIAGLLDKFGLEFLRFEIDRPLRLKYRKNYPDDPQERNLKNWAMFEKRNPAAFIGMYSFWCRKT